jgi:tripartite-type tricarboxylate transporter receptor subunit TctC
MIRTVLFIVGLLLAGAAAGQGFPSRPVRIIVPNPAGGTVELVARALAQSMSPALGQPVIVDLRPGAETMIGTEAAARAAADGHTLVMIGTSFALNPLVRKLPYETLKDFTPLARLVTLPLVIAVHPSVPAKSLGELVGLAKAKPSELDYAAFATARLAGEMFKHQAGIEMNFIPYQGGVQATAAVAGGHVKVLAGPISDATPHIAAGRLRPLAVTSLTRSEVLKEIPTVAESGYPGYEFVNFIGAAAPSGMSAALVQRLSGEMLRALEAPEARAAFARLSITASPQGAEQFDRFIRLQMKKYEAVLKQSGIKFD